MGQGNYIALQPLRPTELKVADYYKSFVDGFIKRNDAKAAAKAKQLQADKKMIGERFKEFKMNPFATVASMTDFAGTVFRDTANYIGGQRLLAEKDPANAWLYLSRAEKAYNDYSAMAIAFGNKDFIDKANAKQQALANGDVFVSSEENQRLSILANQIPISKRNAETGEMEFYLPNSNSATDEDKLIKLSGGELVAHYTTPDEVDMLRSNKSNGMNGFIDKQVFDIARSMSDEYSKNYDGNRTDAKKWFSEERGERWFTSRFGQYNPNRIDPIVKQYAISNGLSLSGDDAEQNFELAKKGIIDNIASLVGRENKVDTRDTALETAIKKQQLANAQLEGRIKRQQLNNPSGRSAMTTTSISYGNQETIIQTDGTMPVVAPMRILSVPKIKGQPTTNNVFGVNKYKNKNGNIVTAYYLGTPSKNGKIVTSRISPVELGSYATKLGYNANDLLKTLETESNNNRIPYIGTERPKPLKGGEYYNDVHIVFKTKENNEDEVSEYMEKMRGEYNNKEKQTHN